MATTILYNFMPEHIVNMEAEPIFYSQEEIDIIRAKILSYYEDEDNDLKTGNDLLDSGCQCTAFAMRNARDQGQPQEIIDTWVKCPPFLFYTSLCTPNEYPMYRIHGVGIEDDGVQVAYGYSALFLLNNVVTLDTDKIVPVKAWSKQQLQVLNSGLIVDNRAFLEVFGFFAFINRNN